MGRKRKWASQEEYNKHYKKWYENPERASRYRCECDNIAVKRIHGCWVCQRCLDAQKINWHKKEDTHERLEQVNKKLWDIKLRQWFKRNHIKWEFGGGSSQRFA